MSKKHTPTIPRIALTVTNEHLFSYAFLSERGSFSSLARELYSEGSLDVRSRDWLVLLNPLNQVIAVAEVNCLTFHNVLYNVREVIQLALLSDARKVAIFTSRDIFHNDRRPTEFEIEFAKRLRKFGKIVDIELAEFLIVGEDSASCYGLVRNNYI